MSEYCITNDPIIDISKSFVDRKKRSGQVRITGNYKSL